MDTKKITCLADVEKLISEAMQQKDTDLLSVLRLIKSKIVFEEKKSGKSLDENGCSSVLLKMVKEHKDSIEAYENAKRDDLADKEKKELEVINLFAPETPSEADIAAFTQSEVNSLKEKNGSVTMRDMGFIMKAVKGRYPLADGSIINKIVKENIG